jgi:hypothetical protein
MPAVRLPAEEIHMIALPSVVVRVWRLAAIASCVMTGATPSVAEVSYLTQSRSVQARAVFSYSDVAARDFGPFDQRVEAGGIPEVHRGSRGTAWQLSTLSLDERPRGLAGGQRGGLERV